jgi:hypothetical protein
MTRKRRLVLELLDQERRIAEQNIRFWEMRRCEDDGLEKALEKRAAIVEAMRILETANE